MPYNRDFAYDDLNRLVTANTGSALWGNGSYAYDAMGNMTSLTLGTSRSVAFAYAGPTPKLTSVNGVAVTYDSAGNESASISARNLLAYEPEIAHYVYDGRGVRVKEWLGLTETSLPYSRTFQYSPDLHLLGYTYTAAGQTWSNSIVWLDALPVGQLSKDPYSPTPLEEELSTFRYTFTDHLGTPLLQMEGADVVWRAEYEPYGSVYEMREGNAEDQRLRFPGQEASGQSNGDERYYNIFRWYRSGWGRYTQVDPAGMNISPTPYAYADEDPISSFDPLGLMTFTWAWGPGKPKPSFDPSSNCKGAATKVACTNLKSVKVHCSCMGCNGIWSPQVTMFVNVDMYIYNGPITPGMAKDKSIVNFATAVDHEVNKHLAHAAHDVEKWLKSWVTNKPTQLECENECKSIEKLTPNYYKAALANTKKND